MRKRIASRAWRVARSSGFSARNQARSSATDRAAGSAPNIVGQHGHLGHVAVGVGGAIGAGSRSAGSERRKRVDERVVHPRQQVRVVGRVRAAVGCGADHPLVHPLDHGDGGAGLGRWCRRSWPRRTRWCRHSRPIGSRAVVRVLGDAGHGQRVHRLQQQGAQPADEHGAVGVDAPRHAVGPEEARVAPAIVDIGGRPAVGPRRLAVAHDEPGHLQGEPAAEPEQVHASTGRPRPTAVGRSGDRDRTVPAPSSVPARTRTTGSRPVGSASGQSFFSVTPALSKVAISRRILAEACSDGERERGAGALAEAEVEVEQRLEAEVLEGGARPRARPSGGRR